MTAWVLPIEIKETGVKNGVANSPQCRQQMAILLFQLWRVARSVWKFLPNCLQINNYQFNIPAEFTLGYKSNSVVGARVAGGGQSRQQLTPAKLTPRNI